MSSIWDKIRQWGSTIKMSIELPVATRHRRDITEKLLKAVLDPNKQQQQSICQNVYLSIISYKKYAKWQIICQRTK